MSYWKNAGAAHLQVKGDPEKLVYVGNLAYSVTWEELKAHMSQAGTVEFCKVLTEDGWDSGKSRGTGCVKYATAEAASLAVKKLAETDLAGRNIFVDHWTQGGAATTIRKGGSHKGTGKAGGKTRSSSFTASGKGWGKKARSSPYMSAGGKENDSAAHLQVRGDPEKMVYVGNLAFTVTWQDLKAHMSSAGTVEFCKVLTEDGWDNGRSRGTGCVRFATAEEANYAITTLAETNLSGRNILVDHWKAGAAA